MNTADRTTCEQQTDAEAATNDQERLQALRETQLLDTPPEEAFDRLTALASKILRAPVSLITLVDSDRQYFKSQVGLGEPWAQQRETPLSHSFCKHVVATGKPLVVTDARSHPLLRENKAISELGVVAYAGIPLETSEGQTLGSFCAIDREPRVWTQEEIDILRDLTLATMTEIALRLTARRLNENLKQLQALEELRDDLTRMIVHDLRTPLTSIVGGLQSLPEIGDLNPQQQEILDISLDGGFTLLGMVNDLLNISKMESGALQLDFGEMEAAQIIDQAWQQVRSLATMKEHTMITEVAEGLPAFTADRGLSLRVLVNLLGNAIKFTPPGGEVTVAAKNYDKNSILFAVSDTGPGIPEEYSEVIFEKFGQLENGRAGKHSTGLGLTFCKMAVEAHGGRMWLESEPGCGAQFNFTLPVRH